MNPKRNFFLIVNLFAVMAVSGGTWTPLVNAPPEAINTMLLLSDGTVMAAGATSGNGWYRLTPDNSGSYTNGTWSTLATMHDTRLYFSSDVLTDGRVFVAGAEYGTGTNSAEVYDPVSDTWTMAPPPPAGQNLFYDSVSKILPNGNVLVAPVNPATYGGTVIYNAALNTWSAGPTLYRGYYQDEASWVKLPDDSILTIDPFGVNSERYIPSLNQWINDANVPVAMYDPYGSEIGASFLLPDGRLFFLGATGNTVFYTPSGNTNPGTWQVGPVLPNSTATPDAPAAMMVNGKILCAVSPLPTSGNHFPSPTSFYEFDPVANSFTQVNGPTGLTYNWPTYPMRMLDLPDGTVLFSKSDRQLYVYRPDGSPLAAGKPTISSISPNGDGSYLLTGTKLNGLSEGAAYGDDAQMDSNYPLVRMTNIFSGTVYYARTFNWSSTSVMTGNQTVSTEFVLPDGLPEGTYSMVVVANGIATDPVTVTFPISLTQPNITTQPASRTNSAGSTATFTAVTIGSGRFAYQWFKGSTALTDGGNVTGSGTATLTLSNVLGGDAGNYSFIVTNVYGAATSSAATLTVIDPVVVTQPAGQTVNPGQIAILSVGVIGSTPLSYQWFKGSTPLTDGGNVSGSTNSLLSLNNVFGRDTGNYSVVITNAYGAVTSSVASLTVIDPMIVTQPANQLFNPGQTATFSVVATGTPPLAYQWRKGGISLTDATNDSLSLTNVQAADTGFAFDVVVRNSFGSVTSSVAFLADLASPDSFDPNADGTVITIALQPDGKILVGGDYSNLGGLNLSLLGRLNTDGSADPAFNPGADSEVATLAVQADGKILAGGNVTSLGAQNRNHIGRLNADGTVDTNFNPGANNYVNSIVVQPDGKLLVGGSFTTLGGTSRSKIGRLNANGTVDIGFNPGANNIVNTLQLQPDGKIIVGGFFTTLGGQPRNHLGRLNADGTVDTNFNPSANSSVDCVALQADGKIVVGGRFTTLGGQSRAYIGRLNADGTLDANFNPGADFEVVTLAVQADGKIVVGGYFGALAGQSRSYLGRLNADGTIDNTFDAGADDGVVALALQEDGKLLVGGNFATLGGQSRNYMGRLMPTVPATESLTYDGANVTWLRRGTLPEVWRTTFELTTNGTNWTMLGTGMRVSGGWSLLGVSVTNGIIRARGYSTGGDGRSSGLVETDLNLNLPNIVSQPVSLINSAGTMATFSVGASGSAPFAYQWFKGGTALTDGGNVTGSANATLILNNVLGGDAGIYTVVITNAYGAVTSSVASLTVINDPSIATQPASRTNSANTTATFSVGASGSAPFAYQWYKGTTAMTDGGNVSGSTSNLLSVGNVQFADATNYYVAVSNNWGSVTSQVAQLTVTPLPFAIITTNGGFGYKNKQFQFTLTGPQNANAIIYASPDLKTWTPLFTNPLVNGSLIFTDLLATNYPQRYYRATLAP